jgi:signal transduction histidine kinase
VSRGSLRLRLLIAGAVSVLAALALSALGLTLLFERHVERRVVSELAVFLDQVIAGLDRGADGALTVTRAPADARFAEPLSGLYWQIQAGGAVLRSRSLWDEQLPPSPGAAANGAMDRQRIVGPGKSELIAVGRRVALPARLGGGTARAVVALDSAGIATATRAFTADLLPYLALLAVFLIVAAYMQVAVGLRPLSAVRKRISAIRQGKARRLEQDFPDEILPLAAEVDALLEARETQIETARARAGDLAHGLKTPLQVLAGDAERLRTKGDFETAAEIAQLARTMQRQIDRELARARMAAGNPDARARVADVVSSVVAVTVRTPGGARLEWSIDIPAPITARIDPDDLAEAVGNLIDNAARHARARVSIRARPLAGSIIITVADDGSGIPQDRLAKALARGGRLDESGDGAGLGLAIVRDIVEAWGGKLDMRTGASGLEADIHLPDGKGALA